MRVWIETLYVYYQYKDYCVTLRVRVWIETLYVYYQYKDYCVTLRVRVWIETAPVVRSPSPTASPSA